MFSANQLFWFSQIICFTLIWIPRIVFECLSLHTNLVEHLNAEIVLYTISDVNMALDWIRSTFLYIRALKNPKHYGNLFKIAEILMYTQNVMNISFKYIWNSFTGFSADLDKCGIETKLQGVTNLSGSSVQSVIFIELYHYGCNFLSWFRALSKKPELSGFL